MKAAVLNRPDGRFDVEDITIDPPIDREVLVQVKACGLCHSDLHLAQANHGTGLPAALGHEVEGIVGGVGLNAIAGARLAGASTMIAVDIQPKVEVHGVFMGSSNLKHDVPLYADLYLQAASTSTTSSRGQSTSARSTRPTTT